MLSASSGFDFARRLLFIAGPSPTDLAMLRLTMRPPDGNWLARLPSVVSSTPSPSSNSGYWKPSTPVPNALSEPVPVVLSCKVVGPAPATPTKANAAMPTSARQVAASAARGRRDGSVLVIILVLLHKWALCRAVQAGGIRRERNKPPPRFRQYFVSGIGNADPWPGFALDPGQDSEVPWVKGPEGSAVAYEARARRLPPPAS